MFRYIFLFTVIQKVTSAETATQIEYLNEMPLDKLLNLKKSFAGLASAVAYENVTSSSQPYLETFGAQAMAFKAPPIKRTDYEEGLYKKDGPSKIGNIFSMSVTTLAFLAFGGYLLCLIVQAVKAKHGAAATPQTFLVNAGIKRPQTHFASYGRRRRDRPGPRAADLSPDQLFSALLQLCEGYVKWSRPSEDLYGS